MRTVVQVGLVLVVAGFAACSSNQPSRFDPTGSGGGATGSGTGIQTIMPSTTTGINTATGGGPGSGGTGGGGVVGDPKPDPCMTTADCGGDGGALFVCTVANQCGRILSPTPCTMHS